MMIEAPPVQQLLVPALFDNLPLVDYQHLVGLPDGAQAVYLAGFLITKL